VEVLGSFRHNVLSSANGDNSTSSLPFKVLCISSFHHVGLGSNFMTLEEMISGFPHVI
jgi:hypothetical protein